MVNSDAFSDRLKMILDHYQLTASAFADSIEVGRSSISHILSGRNKPSLDFILKVLHAYPNIDLYWLMNGKGTFLKSTEPTPKKEPLSTERENPKENAVESEAPATYGKGLTPEKEIKRIIVFYKDGTFEAFDPVSDH